MPMGSDIRSFGKTFFSFIFIVFNKTGFSFKIRMAMASLCILFTTYRINKLDINKFSTTVNSYFARAHRESLHVFRFFRALNVSSSLFSSLFSSPCSRSSIVTWPSTLGT